MVSSWPPSAKAKLSELVEKAARGEDTLITVRGSVKPRLTAATPALSPVDTRTWMDQLRDLDHLCTGSQHDLSTESILDELRSERF
jgi:antitoxin (DNA-binding transcriptional repressor) of toxin-antitoxin stability system